MSAHATTTAIEQAVAAFARQRFQGTEHYLEAKDALDRQVRGLIRQLRRQLGTPEMLSLGTGRRTFGGRSFEVVARIPRKQAERAATRIRKSISTVS